MASKCGYKSHDVEFANLTEKHKQSVNVYFSFYPSRVASLKVLTWGQNKSAEIAECPLTLQQVLEETVDLKRLLFHWQFYKTLSEIHKNTFLILG